MGIGGMLWVYGNRYRSWRKSKGYGVTVMDGEMSGVGEILDEVRRYEGLSRRLVIGVDNVGVLKCLRRGRGMCGKEEQKVREWGMELLAKGWSIEWRWVPGHVGMRENEEAERLAKEGVYMEEEEEENVLSWGCWEQGRKERVERVWKEYWKERKKGKMYFGKGMGEKGHKGKRGESIFLFWMRTGHGGMRGTRYRRGEGLCECGEREDRDHILLKCKIWEEERRVIWTAWEKNRKGREWMDMKWLLHEKEGIEAVTKFGRETGWMDLRKGERRNWDRSRKEEWGRRWVESGSGKIREREGERRRKNAERMRMKREEEREKGKCRAGTPIASVPTLGVYSEGRRKVLGEIRNGESGGRRKYK